MKNREVLLAGPKAFAFRTLIIPAILKVNGKEYRQYKFNIPIAVSRAFNEPSVLLTAMLIDSNTIHVIPLRANRVRDRQSVQYRVYLPTWIGKQMEGKEVTIVGLISNDAVTEIPTSKIYARVIVSRAYIRLGRGSIVFSIPSKYSDCIVPNLDVEVDVIDVDKGNRVTARGYTAVYKTHNGKAFYIVKLYNEKLKEFVGKKVIAVIKIPLVQSSSTSLIPSCVMANTTSPSGK